MSFFPCFAQQSILLNGRKAVGLGLIKCAGIFVHLWKIEGTAFLVALLREERQRNELDGFATKLLFQNPYLITCTGTYIDFHHSLSVYAIVEWPSCRSSYMTLLWTRTSTILNSHLFKFLPEFV